MHIILKLDVEGRGAEIDQAATHERHLVAGFDDAVQDIRQLFENVDARLVGQSQRPHDTPPVEPGKIVDFLFEQLLVGKNDLLACERADTR